MGLFDTTDTDRGNADEQALYGSEKLPGDDAMFAPSVALRRPLAARSTELYDAGFSREDVVKRNRAYVQLAHDSALPTPLIEKIYTLDTNATLKALRGTPDDADDAAAQVVEWREANRQQARETYGQERADRYAGWVEDYLRAHPQLRDRLDQTGHRHHPDIVTGLTDHVRRLHE